MKTATKTFSWLIVSGILIFCTTGLSTGNWWGAFISALSACVIKTPVYSIHETLFESLWERKKKNEIELI
jgi:uncharacterized membrane protein